MTDDNLGSEPFTLADFHCSCDIMKIGISAAEVAELQLGKSIQCKLCLGWVRLKINDQAYLAECMVELAAKGKAILVLTFVQLILLIVIGIYVGPLGSLIVFGVGLAVFAMIKSHYGDCPEMKFDLVEGTDPT